MKDLTRAEVIKKVNLTPNLRKKLKAGSFDYFAGRALIKPVGEEQVPRRKMWRFKYSAEAVAKIADAIGYKK